MARRALSVLPVRKGTPLWLVSFADTATLMLCFLIMLASFSVMDRKNEWKALRSVDAYFGKPEGTLAGNDRTFPPLKAREAVLPQGFAEDAGEDIRWRQTGSMQILSMGSGVLFTAGGTILTERGVALLDSLVPYLQKTKHPFIVAGHSAPRQDEEGKVVPWQEAQNLSPSWGLSYERARTVYEHLAARGLPKRMMTMEAFGEFRPKYDNNTPEGRAANRRVELVLDTGDEGNAPPLPWGEREKDSHYFRGFRFDLTIPGRTDINAAEPTEGDAVRGTR